MKKLFAVLAILFAIGTTSVFAKGNSFAIGAQGGYPLYGALTFKVSSVPCVFAVNFSAHNNLVVGVTADWWTANPTISGTWGWYYGLGLYGGAVLGGNYFSAQIAPRALVGTNVFLLDNFLELYLQGGWIPTLTISNGGVGFDAINFFGEAGFRFWF